MRSKRFIRLRGRRGSKKGIDLELSSLMDILTILLVFLIMNYTTSEVELSIPKSIKIPLSVSETNVKKGVNIQMSKDFEVWVDNKQLIKLENGNWNDIQSLKLRNELLVLKDQVEKLNMKTENASPFSGVINLIMDKELDYKHIKNIMDISVDAGYEQFKFIVLEGNKK